MLERVDGVVAAPSDVEGYRLRTAVQDQKYQRAVWISESDIFQAVWAEGIGSDALRAPMDEFACKGKRREIYRRNRFRPSVVVTHRNHSAAIRAAAKMRLRVLIQSQVPQDHRLRPTAHGMDDQPHLFDQQVSLLPIAAGTFRHPDGKTGKALVEFGLGRRVAAVAMQ